MSNIAEDLLKILTSRYGKDVRQAIHDSIETCYNDGVALDMEIEPKTTDGVNIADITINGETTKLYNGLPIDDTTTAADKVWSSDKVDTELDAKADSADLATVATSGSYEDLSDKPTIPAAQVQSDWSESDSSDPSYIKNKPTIPTKTIVSVNQKVSTGANIADITVDGVTTSLYAEGTNVSVTPKVATGVNIADITVDGVTSSLYAEKGSDVSILTKVSQGQNIADITIDGTTYPLYAKEASESSSPRAVSIQLIKASGGTQYTGGIEIAGGESYDFYSDPIPCNTDGRISDTLTYTLADNCKIKLVPNTASATDAHVMDVQIWETDRLSTDIALHTTLRVITSTNVGATGYAACNFDTVVNFCLYDASVITTRLANTIADIKGDKSNVTTIDEVLIALAGKVGFAKSTTGVTVNTNLFNTPTQNLLYRSGNIVQLFLTAKAKAASSAMNNEITVPTGFKPNGGTIIGFHCVGNSPIPDNKVLRLTISSYDGSITIPADAFLGGTGANSEWLCVSATWITTEAFPS